MEIERKYGVEATIYFPLITAGSQAFKANPTLAVGDSKISKDDGAFANTSVPTVTPAAGKKVKLVLTAVQMQAKVVSVILSDVAGAEWEDQMIIIRTFGHDSALFDFNLGDDKTGTVTVPADGKTVTIKDADGNTMRTLTRSAGAPYVWTPS